MIVKIKPDQFNMLTVYDIDMLRENQDDLNLKEKTGVIIEKNINRK